MKFTSYFLVLLLVLLSVACDDDLNNVGGSIQPGGDEISVETDTFTIKARTISLDSIYAWSTSGLLGNYEDDTFGAVKSDYLCEFYCPEALKFLGKDVKIDSVRIDINYINYYGDTLAPMGLSVYRVTSHLTNNFYTNIDPLKYCDMTQMIGQQTYSIAASPKYTSSGITVRTVSIDLNRQIGLDFYQESLKENNALQNSATLRTFFPGIYVTTTFGKNNLIESENTSLNIYYNYTLPARDGTDSTATSVLFIAATPEVIQLNHVESTIPHNLLNDEESVYIKSPAGVCVELELPVLEIKAKLETNGGEDLAKKLNSAKITLSGYTEKEEYLGLGSVFEKPSYLLFIDKDSIQKFFLEKQRPNYKTNTILTRNQITNTYDIGNIASIITEYKKREGLNQNPKFLLVPVNVTVSSSVISGIHNYMKPLTSIIRKEDKYMKMGVIFSKY